MKIPRDRLYISEDLFTSEPPEPGQPAGPAQTPPSSPVPHPILCDLWFALGVVSALAPDVEINASDPIAFARAIVRDVRRQIEGTL